MNEPKGLYKTIRIQAIKEEAEGFKTFVFEDGHNITYRSGQYLTLVLNQGDDELHRSYSITSSPILNEPLSIGVKRIENGSLSRRLVDDAKPGDTLQTIGSGGFFILPDDIHKYNQLFFYAAGSGITPVFSLVKTALHQYPHLSVVLIYNNASPQKTIFLTQLKNLQNLFPHRFHLQFFFSNSVDLSRARLHRDLILELQHQLSVHDKNKQLFYICGPESYMRLCTYTLQEMGIDPVNIKRENFIIHTVNKRDAAPPDKESHTAHIHFGNAAYKVVVQYPDSILKAAKKQGIALPYSCEAGRCGNCVAKCIRGTVWHSYNEVLTEKELQKGLVLTCVGHPVGGDVVLEV